MERNLFIRVNSSNVVSNGFFTFYVCIFLFFIIPFRFLNVSAKLHFTLESSKK